MVADRITTEQAAEEWQVAEERYLLHPFALGVGEHPADHDRLAVRSQHLGVDLVLGDCRHPVASGCVGVIRSILVDLDFHDHPIVRGDLRGHLQRQRRLLERGAGGTAGAGLLVGHLRTGEDLCRLLIGGDHLGLRHHLAIAGRFHGRQLQVEDQVIGDIADAEARGAGQRTQIDEGNWRVILVYREGTFSLERPASEVIIILNSDVAVLAVGRPLAIIGNPGPAPAHPQALVVTDGSLDDARLDHHLTHRDVQLGDDTAQLVQTILGQVGDQAVGTVVIDDRTAHVLLLGAFGKLLEQAGDIRRLGIVQLHHLATQRRQLGDLLLRLQLLTFARGDFVGRRHQQNVTDLALV
ncbi:hypothetical protein D3C78_1073350 [compost metagenome]